MAGEWLKFECSLPEKPETMAITVAMGWDDTDLTVGKLMRLFRWFDQQTLDGNAKAVTPALLDRLIGVPGFVAAVQAVGWLIISDDGLALNNFDKHNGQSAKSRSETAKRVANHRAKKAPQEPDSDYQRLCLPRPIRAAVLARDGNSCVYCHRKEGEYGPMETKLDGFMHMDHVIPLTQGGSDDLDNLVTACRPCNMFKGDRTPDECGLSWPMLGEKRAGNRNPVTPALAREEKRREESNTSSPAKLPTCPHLKILELYAKHLPELPQPKPELWDGARSKDLAARWKWLLTKTRASDGARYATNEAEALAWLERFFGYVARSDFLSGRSGKWSNCDLGWLMKADNFAKVVQGNYENKEAT